MPRKLLLIITFCLIIWDLFAAVVINEVCYDPPGADLGMEWIELYNPTPENIDLTGSKIYSGGSSYQLDFVFPYFVLRPGRFVLIGGDQVPNRHFTHNFSFQNGGSASDGIRFVNADSTYTDTVIYDTPNENGLLDDSGNIAMSLAEDAPEGSSLARIKDGLDSDLCALDFRVELNPTPGMLNRVQVDYALSDAQYNPEIAGAFLNIQLCNLSNFAPNHTAYFSLYNGAQLIHEEEISPLDGGENRQLTIWLEESFELLFAEIILEDDPNELNNVLYISSLGSEGLAPIFSEIYAVPQSTEQEWIEVFSPAAKKTYQDYIIYDAAENSIRFSLPPIPGYFVLCRDPESLLARYPQCPPAAVIQASGWATLNNNGDNLILLSEENEEILDSMSYSSADAISGMALQRVMNSNSADEWRLGTPNPGQENIVGHADIPEHNSKLKVFGSPCDPRKSEEIKISHKFSGSAIRANCSIYDLSGRKLRQIADNELLSPEGVITWDGKDNRGAFVKRGLYIILWESQDSSGGKVYRHQLTAVIK
nr:hypothetical protein [Candidatus Cloacimonadota bacterium]